MFLMFFATELSPKISELGEQLINKFVFVIDKFL